MPRVTITPIDPKGPHPGIVAAEALDFSFANSDTAQGNQFVGSGHDLLLIFNNDAAAQTFTLTSVNDPFKRQRDITAYSLGIGEYAVFYFGSLVGWKQAAGGFIFLDTSVDNVQFTVVKIPQILS